MYDTDSRESLKRAVANLAPDEERGPNIDLDAAYETASSAVDHFGERSQVLKALEELAELQVELHGRLSGLDSRYDIAGETADVFIMCLQLCRIVGIELFESALWHKLDRLKEMIDG